ncbi:peroxiredoxin-like family protein [Rhodococcus sp. NPDC004095]
MTTNDRPAARGTHPAPGDVVPPRTLTTISGDRITLPDPGALTHLQFRRFAGCPICNVHLREIARRADEIDAAGVREIAVFHSTAEAMRPYQGDLPFAVVADPDRSLYREFGIESAPGAVLHPRVWSAPLRPGSWAVVMRAVRAGGAIGPGGESILGLPADLLLAPDGSILAARYGRHAADHWSVDELLRLAAAANVRLSRPAGTRGPRG